MADSLTCVVNLSNLLPSCAALQSVAGVRPFGYFCRRVDIASYTTASDGTVTGVTLAAGAKLKKFQTQKFQNSGEFGVAASQIGKTRFAQTYNWRVFYRTQADRNAMRSLILAQDVVIFQPNNDNQIEVYGKTLGLDATTVKGGTGAKLDDDNTALLTLTGAEPDLPALFNTVTTATTEDADLATNIAYLDNLVG